jgi:UDP-glucose 4-epimerase
MREELLIPIFLKKAFAGEQLTIAGDGSQYRNFIYVEDLAEAHILALDTRAENQIYNLEGIRKISIKEVAETINQLLKGKVEIVHTPARPGDYQGKEVSGRKIKEELNWEPKTDFIEGMKKTLDWYKQKHNV